MNREMIEIFGITPTNKFPTCSQGYPCTELCETDKLCIPCKKPDIRDILQIFVTVSICSYKTLCTPCGKKLVINALKHIKILYTANNSCNDVHCAHFDVPFCTFILLKDNCNKVVDICTAIEHIFIKQLDCRCFSLSTIIFICPIFKKKNDCSCNDECDDNCDINCDEKPCNISINYSDNIIFEDRCDNFNQHRSYKKPKNKCLDNKNHFTDNCPPYYNKSKCHFEENCCNDNYCDDDDQCDYDYYKDDCCKDDYCDNDYNDDDCYDNNCCDDNNC